MLCVYDHLCESGNVVCEITSLPIPTWICFPVSLIEVFFITKEHLCW
jgi:hypothetical protein